MDNNDRIYLFDGFTLDLGRGCVLRAGEPVHLRPQTYEVLKYLAENPDRLISKDKLIEEVWKGRAVTDGSLGKCIEEVREALGPEAKQFVRNVRGRGYIFDTGIKDDDSPKTMARSERVEVVRVLVHEEETDTEKSAPTIVSTASHWRFKRTLFLVAALLVIATAAIAYWQIRERQARSNSLVVPFHEMDIARLTTSGNVTHAAISRDGKYVAHVSADEEGYSLWIRNVTAPSSVRIAGSTATKYVWVTFAPDGDSVYYLALDPNKGDTELYRVPVLGGPSTKTAYDVGPIGFSPDGKQITFIRIDGKSSHLIIANSDGTNERVLVSQRQPDFFWNIWKAPAWSPDGKTIACQVRLHDERGQFETIIGVDVASGSNRKLTSGRWNSVGQPIWFADGKSLLLTASQSATAPAQIWSVALKSGEATRVTHDLNDYHGLSLTADSSKLLAVQNHSTSGIWVAPEGDAGRAKQITSDVGWIEEMAWTPDGRIVYRSNVGGTAEIWVANNDGSSPKQLTVDARVSHGLSVSADGRYVFFSSDRAGRLNIWRVNLDGNDLKQITFGEGELYPDCMHSGEWVVYQQGEVEPTLWKVSANGGKPEQLTISRGGRPAFSPDDKLIAYHYLDPDLEGSQWSIGIISSGGDSRVKRLDFPPTVTWRFVRWSPQRAIAYANSSGGFSDIWLQNVDGGAPKQLTAFKAERILAFDWSRDGSSLALVRGVETSDVVLITQVPK